MIKHLLFIGLLFLAQEFEAQGFQVNFQGQKQQGMGGAGNALPLDAASVFFNPGSVSSLKENSVNIAFTPTFAAPDVTSKLSQYTVPAVIVKVPVNVCVVPDVVELVIV